MIHYNVQSHGVLLWKPRLYIIDNDPFALTCLLIYFYLYFKITPAIIHAHLFRIQHMHVSNVCIRTNFLM